MVFGEKSIGADGRGQKLLKLFHSTVEAGGRAYRQHHHTEFEISVFKSGSGLYRTENKQYRFKAGDVFLFAGDELHCITEIDAGEKMDLINVHFEPRFVWSSGNDMFNFKFLKIFLGRNKNFENRLEAENETTKQIAELIYKMDGELEDKKTGYEMFVKVYLLQILSLAARGFDYITEDERGGSFKASSLIGIENAINYINENLSEDISLDALAENARMSRTYFCTAFKRLNGISPWDYITIKRVDRAVEMLKKTDMSMLEIAYACGFNNSTNFNRCFKKITGKTPGEYRRS